MNKTEKLTSWVALYTEEMVRWAFLKTSSIEIAKDLVQDTFMVAAEKFDSFQGKSSSKTWLFAILNHKIIDYYRKKVKQPMVSGEKLFSEVFDENGSWQSNRVPTDWHEEEDHLLDNDDFNKVLKSCMDALPEHWHICVRMKYLLSKSGEEICQELNITPSNYWQIIHRAKLQLRSCVEQNWFKN